MGIWVRSQDGNILVLVKAFSTGLNSKRQEAACVFGRADAIDRLGLPLGDYATEAEAAKVLDMIEGAIGTLTVFQMPPAGFSKPACPLDLTRTENYPCSRGDCDCDVCKDTQGKEE